MEEVFTPDGLTVLEVYDLALGRLEQRTRTVHHDAVAAVTEVFHYETLAEYPNGGKDVRRVVDVPGVEAKAAYDEEVSYTAYIPYTEEELAQIKAEEEAALKNSPLYQLQQENRLLKAQVSAAADQMEFLESCIVEMAQVVYA